MTTLVVVESPGKIKKLRSFLGPGYDVQASVGHIRDLPEDEEGISKPDYRLHYVITKKDVVARLKAAAAKADDVILATDPDREGEAIAWHLQQVLGLKNAKRVTFDEITKEKIQAAFSRPRTIDLNRVAAQEARRGLDRLTGYRVSGALRRLTGQNLSAGRVQSPAQRLVVEREEAIERFVPVLHYGVEAQFDTAGKRWKAAWRPSLPAGEKLWRDRVFAQRVSGLRSFTVESIQQEEKLRKPSAPFTTSTLQQFASSKLKLKPRRTMMLAQKLYENGVITYHRTDTPNLSDEAIAEVWDYLRANGMTAYIPEAANHWKAKERAQEAHEACRPAHIARKDEDLAQLAGIEWGKDKKAAEDAVRLYELIWNRAVASQMKAARFNVTTVTIATEPLDGVPQKFRAGGKVVLFDGWMRLSARPQEATDEEQEEGAEDAQELPKLAQGQQLSLVAARLLEQQTEPPRRYTEAELVKALEEYGIGRPSTYAAIMGTLEAREYVSEGKDRRLRPTDIGRAVIEALRGRFAFAEYRFTQDVEATLDRIAAGENLYRPLLAREDARLDQELKQLTITAAAIPQHKCPKCDGGILTRRTGKKKGSHWWGCSNYPACDYTAPDDNGEPGEPRQAPVSTTSTGEAVACPVCQKPMSLRTGKTGKFWGCTGYPACHCTLPDEGGNPGPVHLCECGMPLSKKTVRKGPNTGKLFWSCLKWPSTCKNEYADANGKPLIGH